MSPLYRRLLLWFCAANIATLLLAAFITERMARHAYASEPDWGAIALEANSVYMRGGPLAFRRWARSEVARGLYCMLFEDDLSVVQPMLPEPPPPDRAQEPSPLPPMLELLPRLLPRVLPQVLAADSIVLRVHPQLLIAGERVLGPDGIERHFVGIRGPRHLRPQLPQLLLLEIILSVLAIGAVGWGFARSIARPVAAVSAATARMSSGALDTRVDPRYARGDDELAQLARDFNGMAARIEALVAHERSVLQDISHELRSPLARLQLQIELARRDAGERSLAQLQRAEREVTRIDQLLGEVLALARLEAGLPGMTREPCELGSLVRARCGEFAVECNARGRTLNLDIDGGVIVEGSPPLLERALDNLLSNALKYGEGAIDVEVRRRGDVAELSVRDHGAGVPEAERAALFRPFFRGSNSGGADGQGLGLTIVARIVRAHGGSIEATNADPAADAEATLAPSGGLRVRVQLPVD